MTTFDDDALWAELEGALDEPLPEEGLRRRIRDLLGAFRGLLRIHPDKDACASLDRLMEQTTAYSLHPDLDADRVEMDTLLYQYPLAASPQQLRALLGHFLHYYINTLCQELRLIAFRAVLAIHSPADITKSAEELSTRVRTLQTGIAEARHVYEKLSPLQYRPDLAGTAHRFTDVLRLNPRVLTADLEANLTTNLDSTEGGPDNARRRITAYISSDGAARNASPDDASVSFNKTFGTITATLDNVRAVQQRVPHDPILPTDFKALVQTMTRPPNLYDELSVYIAALDRRHTGELIRRVVVAEERYSNQSYASFHCGTPFLYSRGSQLRESFQNLAQAYSLSSDSIDDQAEFASRVTKIVTTSMDKLTRFFIVTHQPLGVSRDIFGDVEYRSSLQNIDVGLTSAISVVDVDGYERISCKNPRFAHIRETMLDQGMKVRYRQTHVVEALAFEKLAHTNAQIHTTFQEKGRVHPSLPFYEQCPPPDPEYNEKRRRINVAPLFVVPYAYSFKAGSKQPPCGPYGPLSGAETSNDICTALCARDAEIGTTGISATLPHLNSQDNGDLQNSRDAPSAFVKLSSHIPSFRVPTFVHSLNIPEAVSRIRTGPSAVKVPSALFQSQEALIDEPLRYDLRFVQSSLLEVEDLISLKADSFDTFAGDFIDVVKRGIDERVKQHMALIAPNLESASRLPSDARAPSAISGSQARGGPVVSITPNTLFLHYYMLLGKLFHIRARLLVHYNHIELVRTRIDSDLRLRYIGFDFEQTASGFDPQEFEAIFDEAAARGNQATSGLGRFGTLFFGRSDNVGSRSSLKANDILTPDGTRVLFREAVRYLVEVVENEFLLAGSLLIQQFSSSQTASQAPQEVDRLTILLFLYEQELALVEQKRRLIDLCFGCYTHSVSYANCVHWLQYISGIIDTRPTYDVKLYLRTRNLGSISSNQALVLRFHNTCCFITEYVAALDADEKAQAADSELFTGMDTEPSPCAAEPTKSHAGDSERTEEISAHLDSLRHPLAENRRSPHDLDKHGVLLSIQQSDTGRCTPISSYRDVAILTFPRYAGFGSPNHAQLLDTSVCDVRFGLGQLVELLSDVEKTAHLFSEKYLMSAYDSLFTRDFCISACYEVARMELSFVARSRRDRGALGTLPQHILKQCRYDAYGQPHNVWRAVHTLDDACTAVNLLHNKRSLGLLTLQTAVIAQALNSTILQVGRKLVRLNLGRGSWTNSCMDDLLSQLVPQKDPEKHRLCVDNAAAHNFTAFLSTYSGDGFVETFDSFQLPADFDFELCLIDPISSVAIKLLRDCTPNAPQPHSYFLSACEEEANFGTLDLSYKECSQYSRIPNFLSPATADDLSGALRDFPVFGTLQSMSLCEADPIHFLNTPPYRLSEDQQAQLFGVLGTIQETFEGRTGPTGDLDTFDTNPSLYRDSAQSLLQRLVYVQACGLCFYRSLLSELVDSVMVPFRNLHTACEIRARQSLLAQGVDISTVSASILLENVTEQTSCFITRRFFALSEPTTTPVLQDMDLSDPFLSFFILAAEYTYLWTTPTYSYGRSNCQEILDKLANEATVTPLLTERTRCIESVLLLHKERLSLLLHQASPIEPRPHTDHRSLTPHSAIDPSVSNVSTSEDHRPYSEQPGRRGGIEGIDVPFQQRILLYITEVLLVEAQLSEYMKAHLLRSQLGDMLHRIAQKHRHFFETPMSMSDNSQNFAGFFDEYIENVYAYQSAPDEHRMLELISEFRLVACTQTPHLSIAQNLGRYSISMSAVEMERRYQRVCARENVDRVPLYDVMCISPYLLDPLAHENINVLIYQYTTSRTARTAVQRGIVPHLVIIPPCTAARTLLSGKSRTPEQTNALLAGLVALYAGYLQFFDYALALQNISTRQLLNAGDVGTTQETDEQMNSLLLNDTSTDYIARSTSYTVSVTNLVIPREGVPDPDQEVVEERSGSSDIGENPLRSSPSRRNHSHSRRKRVRVHPQNVVTSQPMDIIGTFPLTDTISIEPLSLPRDGGDNALADVISDIDTELHIDVPRDGRRQAKAETEKLCDQLKLVNDRNALDFKIVGPQSPNPMIVYFSRLMALAMFAIRLQHETHSTQKESQKISPTSRQPSSTARFGPRSIPTHPGDSSLEHLESLADAKSAALQVHMAARNLGPVETLAIEHENDTPILLPGLEEDITTSPEALIALLKIVYVLRDMAFERLVGTALLCHNEAYARADVGSILGVLETLEAIRRTTGLSFAGNLDFSHLVQQLLLDVSADPSADIIPDMLNKDVMDGKIMTALVRKKNVDGTVHSIVTTRNLPPLAEEVCEVPMRESNDKSVTQMHPPHTCANAATVVVTATATKTSTPRTLDETGTERLSLGLHASQSQESESDDQIGRVYGVPTPNQVGKPADVVTDEIDGLPIESSYSNFFRLYFKEFTHVSYAAFPFLDALFEGACTGQRYTPLVSPFSSYQALSETFLHMRREVPVSTIAADCGTRQSLGPDALMLENSMLQLNHYLTHFGLNCISNAPVLVRKSFRPALRLPNHASELYGVSQHSSASGTEPSFNDLFGNDPSHSSVIPVDALVSAGRKDDVGVLRVTHFLNEIRGKYQTLRGRREALALNRHAFYSFSDLFLTAPMISLPVLYAGASVLGLKHEVVSKDLYSLTRHLPDVCALSYNDLFEPFAYPSSTGEASKPSLTMSAVDSSTHPRVLPIVGRIRLYRLHLLIDSSKYFSNCRGDLQRPIVPCPQMEIAGGSLSMLGDRDMEEAPPIHLSGVTTLQMPLNAHWNTFHEAAIATDVGLRSLPAYADTVLSYHTNPLATPCANSELLRSDLVSVAQVAQKYLYEAFVHFLEELHASTKSRILMRYPQNYRFLKENRRFTNPAPIYPIAPGLYGLAPADIMIPYNPSDSTVATRYLHTAFGRHMVTVDSLCRAASSAAESQNSVFLTNYTLAQIIDRFQSILYGSMTQRIGMTLSSMTPSLLGLHTQVRNSSIYKTEALRLVREQLASLKSTISSYTASYLHVLRGQLTALHTLSDNTQRELELLPSLMMQMVSCIYSDALAYLFARITAEREISCDINDDASAIARRTVVSERVRALTELGSRVMTEAKFFLECAEKERQMWFYEEALALETRFVRKAVSLNHLRVGTLLRRIKDSARLFELEYKRLSMLHTSFQKVAASTESDLRLEFTSLVQAYASVSDDVRHLRTEIRDRLSIISKARNKDSADDEPAAQAISTLAPITAITEALDLPEGMTLDVERVQLNITRVRGEVSALREKVYELKKQLAREATHAEDRMRTLRRTHTALKEKRKNIVRSANELLVEHNMALAREAKSWEEEREVRRSEYWSMFNYLHKLRVACQNLERRYARMLRELRSVRSEGEKLILGGLMPLSFK
ncbi:hypothetical protein GMRT_11820 [Giardia muris]|uniref:Uncharacterized protein n=1 Tax=Giardia muris TaxID=5742 RepID=A0A4Z1T797_GIAMU|nr:hypothetical protein GMRT_11820 [Giardia muris]|eukprot:TNJ29007.1 hypothetical protein GMRT_11820 [Giardia muris]